MEFAPTMATSSENEREDNISTPEMERKERSIVVLGEVYWNVVDRKLSRVIREEI